MEFKNTHDATQLKCRVCNRIKNIQNFTRHKNIKSGYQKICVDCERERVRDYYHRNKETILARQKLNYRKKRDQLLEDLKNHDKKESKDSGSETSSISSGSFEILDNLL